MNRPVLLAVLLCGIASADAQTVEPAVPKTPFGLVQPARRSHEAAAPAPLDLPPSARLLTPMSLDLVVRRRAADGGSHTTRQHVDRTTDRMHVSDSDGGEWLFQSNPVDARRVTGWFIDHAAGEIVVYEESDLRNSLGIQGWADVLTFGLTPSLLRTLKPTGRERTVGDLHFTLHAATDASATTREVWWNEAQLLPAALVTALAGTTVELTVERISPAVDPTLLQAPAARYPTYRLIDYPDRLERH